MPIKRVIITAPHSLCIQPYRDCDTRAQEAAERIYSALKPHYSTSLHLSTLYRLKSDGNRKYSRNSNWRKEVAKDIMCSVDKYGRDAVMVLDIHSCWAGSEEYTDEDGKEPVLSFISFDQKISALCDKVRIALGKPVSCFESSRRNDITLQCKELGLCNCILIEHDEDDLRLTSEDFDKYIPILMDYIANYDNIQPIKKLPPRRAGPTEFYIGDYLVDEYTVDMINMVIIIIVVLVCMVALCYAGYTVYQGGWIKTVS